MNDQTLLAELTPKAASLLERHLETAKEWFPHELVPWGRGRDFGPDYRWDPDESPLPDGVRSALFVNLLTEDNLPYYFATIDSLFQVGDAQSSSFDVHDTWRTWARRWTAEEHRHSIVIRDYLTVSRAVDPVVLERARMQQVAGGVVPTPRSAVDALVYVALQELATRVAHRNTGKALGDREGYEVMARVAADENLHFLFYRDLTNAALELDPSATVVAMERQVREFEMPGTGIAGFSRHALAIAQAGIYDLSGHHDLVLVPTVMRAWQVDRVEGLDAAAEQARDKLMSRMGRIARAGRRMAERRDERMAAAAS